MLSLGAKITQSLVDVSISNGQYMQPVVLVLVNDLGLLVIGPKRRNNI